VALQLQTTRTPTQLIAEAVSEESSDEAQGRDKEEVLYHVRAVSRFKRRFNQAEYDKNPGKFWRFNLSAKGQAKLVGFQTQLNEPLVDHNGFPSYRFTELCVKFLWQKRKVVLVSLDSLSVGPQEGWKLLQLRASLGNGPTAFLQKMPWKYEDDDFFLTGGEDIDLNDEEHKYCLNWGMFYDKKHTCAYVPS